MSKKCHTSKYKRQRAKERVNKVTREARIRQFNAERNRQIRAQHEAAARAWRVDPWNADPRRAHIQYIAHILYRHIRNNPVYQMERVSNLFGFSINDITRNL